MNKFQAKTTVLKALFEYGWCKDYSGDSYCPMSEFAYITVTDEDMQKFQVDFPSIVKVCGTSDISGKSFFIVRWKSGEVLYKEFQTEECARVEFNHRDKRYSEWLEKQ